MAGFKCKQWTNRDFLKIEITIVNYGGWGNWKIKGQIILNKDILKPELEQGD